MKTKHHIIVSAENNPYIAWQCKLFHYSCVSRLGQFPVIVVHEFDRNWHPDFIDIVEAGGIVRSAPSYRQTRAGDDYSPRNTAGTLLQASAMGYKHDDLIVLCDPDMIFVRKPSFPKQFSADYYPNLDYEEKDVLIAASKLGITRELLKRRMNEVRCGVPHVVPAANARLLAEAWLEAIDAFTPGIWEISMYAFGLAVIKSGLELALTSLVTSNYTQCDPVGKTKIIHYCHGDDEWNKRDYFAGRRALKVWDPPRDVRRQTILGEIISQIDEARSFYADRKGRKLA